jgi:hypothetical protein
MVEFGTQEDIRQENNGQENESQKYGGLCRVFSCPSFSCRICPGFRLKIFAGQQEINR